MVKQLIDHHKAFAAQREVRGKRIGVVGYSSPWLVASNVDYLLAKRRWGIEFIDIPMEEVYCPVSYTHLRAHETGRNLVCRLLLEKKKNRQNSRMPSSA